ncbi:MAG: GNAT family N-acetyltransferase [Acidimicrobiales bacterium]
MCEPGSFLIVAERDDGTVAGFIAGSEDTRALYRSFLRHDAILAAAPVAGRLLRHWRRVAETLAHGSSGGGATGRGAELLAVAVDAAGHGQGIGGSLVTAFLGEINRRGVAGAHVVVGEDNHAAVALYRGAGFQTVDRFELHLGTASLVMQWAPGS